MAACVATTLCGWGLGAAGAAEVLDPGIRTVLREWRGADAIGDEPGDPVELTGRLAEDVVPGPEGAWLRLNTSSLIVDGAPRPCRGGVALTVSGTTADSPVDRWLKGRMVRAPALLRRPARYLNPGVPDFEVASMRRGIALVGTIKSVLLVDVVEPGGWFDERAASIRAAARRVLDRDVGRHHQRSAAIVSAILIGDRAGLDEETEHRLQSAGTSHVLAISGGNIAILAGA